ncbi:MAG: HAMP domain-containing sensor histidine kinase [Balneolales bacterium]
MNKYLTFRWILLGIGLAAIVGLTGMNVYSLYSLHRSTVNQSLENQKHQLSDISNQVRSRFRQPVQDIWKLNMEEIQLSIENNGPVPEPFLEMLSIASKDSIFSAIYFSEPDCMVCNGEGQLQRFDPESNSLEWVNDYPDFVIDGLGMAKTRMLGLVNDYRWKTRVIFDTHRSMSIALIKPRDHAIIGYLNFVINEDYFISRYLGPLLSQSFGDNQSGTTAWLINWTRGEVLFSTDITHEYSRREADIRQPFSDLLHDWDLRASVNHNPVLATSRASLYRNLGVMGTTVLFLIGAMVFMFVTAQRERHLAVRQAGFLANVTHELKTPLAVMQAAGENLADGRVKDKERLISYGEHIFDESIRLRQMIDKLLDVAKADAGRLALKTRPLALNKMVRSYLDSHGAYLEQRGFTLQFKADPDNPFIFADEDCLNTIINNLVENAVKYSPSDKFIGLSIKTDQNLVYLKIEDHGLGIQRKDQKRIFDKFYRVEDALTAKTKGHGLGLSIVRNLTHLNGGHITLKSTYRKGSVFTLQFPVYTNHETPNNNDKRAIGAAEYINK